MNRVEQLKKIQEEAASLFAKKNTDYGDAFANYGPVGVLVRMGDKLSRLQSITKNGITLTDNENLRDTLIDLHNYAAMAIMLIDEPTKNEDSPAQNLFINEELLKDVMYSDSNQKPDNIAFRVYDIVCGENIELETCKILVAATLDTYEDRDVACAYLAVALKLAYEGQNITYLNAALRTREDFGTDTPQWDRNFMESLVKVNKQNRAKVNEQNRAKVNEQKHADDYTNIIVAEAGVGMITTEDITAVNKDENIVVAQVEASVGMINEPKREC